ncbi:MAG TPA: TIGR03936 family radical SAM-associated protein [Clostridia bacterium]|nr:TIGR03936 family radical SAM-associated protein [Clostridia bacterium]
MPVIRIEFTKEGNAKYISHLDLIRAIQRAVRRADVPVEYSKGFNPHSKIAYGPALAVGISSSAEYMDVNLKNSMEETELVERLNASLPPGIRAVAAKYLPDGAPSLNAVIDAAAYRITGRPAVWTQGLEKKIRDFFEKESIFIERTDKKGRKKQVNIKPMIAEIQRVLVTDGGLLLDVILDTGSRSNLKPSDLVEALERDAGTHLQDVCIHRKGLLIKRGGRYLSPLEVMD